MSYAWHFLRALPVGALLIAGAYGVAVAQSAPLEPDSSWKLSPVRPVASAYRIHSRVLDETRRVFVSLPESHDRTTRSYPLVLVLDGEVQLAPVVAAVNALSRAGHLPESVVVGIENTDRRRDLSPPGLPVSGNDGTGRADRFLRFLLEELRPALAAELRAAGPITLVGHSSGGLFVHYAAGVAPGRVDRVLALDSPMHLGDGAAIEPLRARVEAGGPALRLVSMENRFGWRADDWASFQRGAPEDWLLVREQVVTEETHESMVWPSLYPGLRRLFSDYSMVSATSVAPVRQLARFDAAAPLGREAPPPARLLRDVVEDRIIEGNRAAATAALDRLIEAYGESDAMDALVERVARVDEVEVAGPTVDELLASPRASPESVAALVGRWRGETWTVGATRRTPLVLELRIDGGRPVGSIATGQAPAQQIEYVAAFGDELHVGVMNGMRPRGLLMYEGTVEDGVFVGRFVLRGVVFRMPDGSELPEMRFRLAREGGAR